MWMDFCRILCIFVLRNDRKKLPLFGNHLFDTQCLRYCYWLSCLMYNVCEEFYYYLYTRSQPLIFAGEYQLTNSFHCLVVGYFTFVSFLVQLSCWRNLHEISNVPSPIDRWVFFHRFFSASISYFLSWLLLALYHVLQIFMNVIVQVFSRLPVLLLSGTVVDGFYLPWLH